jgi:hypothetical protein
MIALTANGNAHRLNSRVFALEGEREEKKGRKMSGRVCRMAPPFFRMYLCSFTLSGRSFRRRRLFSLFLFWVSGFHACSQLRNSALGV